MTIVILDRDEGELPPYAEWLADAGDLVLITRRPAVGTAGYAAVHHVPDDASAELTVLDIARATTVSALVATSAADLVRAGALRDHLGIAGQSRADATVFADPVATRARLHAAGVPTIPVGAVLKVSDLFWYRHHWGALRVRRRKDAGWPTAAILWDDTDLRAFTANGLAPSLISVPSLFVEPFLDGDRHINTQPITRATRAALPAAPGYRVTILNTSTGQWLVDSVEPVTTAAAVRAQVPFTEEVTRWAS